MELSEYINLLNTLDESALNIWGFLLTISIGIVAFLGTVKSIRMPVAIVLFTLFIGFATSNHRALKRNFDQRTVIQTSMKVHAKASTAFGKNYDQNRALVVAFSVTPKRVCTSMVFQLIVSFLVSMLIIFWPLLQSKLLSSSDRSLSDS